VGVVNVPRDGAKQVGGQLSTSRSGVTVRKTAWVHDETPAVVKFEVESYRDDPVRVRVVEDVSSELADDVLGSHPKYGKEKWTRTDRGTFVFSDEVSPEETCTTLYAVATDDQEAVEEYLTQPLVELESAEKRRANTHIDTMTNDDESDDGRTEREQTADETQSGEGDFDDLIPEVDDGDAAGSPGETNGDVEMPADGIEDLTLDFDGTGSDAPGVDSAAEATDGVREAAEAANGASDDAEFVTPNGHTLHDPESDEADDGTNVEVTTPENADESSETATADDEGRDDAETDLVSTLVEELSARDLTEEETEVLRESLGVTVPNSIDARLRHVQNRVDDLAAYTDSLEEFIDENGTAEQLFANLQDDVDSLQSTVHSLESSLAASEMSLSSLEDRLDELERETVSETTFEEQLAELEALTVTESTFEDRLDELEQQIVTESTFEDRLEEVHERMVAETAFEERFDELDERTVSEERFDERVEAMTEEFATEDAVESRLDTVQEDVETLRSDVETGKQWRSNLNQAIQLPGGASLSDAEDDGESPEVDAE
jgi:hypothetical protein